MEDKAMQVVQGVKPNVVNWIGAAIGAALAWWTGLPPLAQALLIVQGADVVAVVAMVAVAVLMADAVDAISPYTLMPLPV